MLFMFLGSVCSCRMLLSVRKKRGRQVSVPGIRKQDNNCLSFIFGAFCQFYRGRDSRAGGNADKDAFLLSDESADGKSVFVLNGDDLVIDGGIQKLGDKACADALNLVRACRAVGKDRGGGGLDCDDFDVRLFGF